MIMAAKNDKEIPVGNDLEQALKDKTLDDIIHALPCSHPIQEEIGRLKAKLEEANDIIIAYSNTISRLEAANGYLQDQLAEARAEVERLSALTGEWCKTAEMYRRFETETSKQTAREICDYLQRSSTDDEISKGYVIDHIKRRFGLEG